MLQVPKDVLISNRVGTPIGRVCLCITLVNSILLGLHQQDDDLYTYTVV